MSGGGFHVRPAATDEIATVAKLFRAYADALGTDLSYQGFEAELTGLPGAYAPPAGALLLAVASGGAAIGCVGVRAMAEPGCCEMKRLHTTPSARGTGVGRVLATAAIEAAAQAGYRTMRLDTLPNMVEAQALYRSLGFETTPAYYYSPVAGTIFMKKTLART